MFKSQLVTMNPLAPRVRHQTLPAPYLSPHQALRVMLEEAVVLGREANLEEGEGMGVVKGARHQRSDHYRSQRYRRYTHK